MLASERATEVVKGRAAQQYGDPTPIAETAAEFWNTWLSAGTGVDEVIRPIEASDVEMMMALHKVARERHAPGEDNLTDICGYTNIYETVKEATK
jgi:Domain of unknown function (DUF6378)